MQLLVGSQSDSRAAGLTSALEDELRALELERIEHPEGAAPPEGAKGAALEWAQLAVTMLGSMPPLVALVRSFVRRNPGTQVTLKVEEDELTLGADAGEAELEAARAWIARRS